MNAMMGEGEGDGRDHYRLDLTFSSEKLGNNIVFFSNHKYKYEMKQKPSQGKEDLQLFDRWS